MADTTDLDLLIQKAASVLSALQEERRMLDVERPVYSLNMIGCVMSSNKEISNKIPTIMVLKHVFDLSLGDAKKLVDLLW